jgi:hypothetical protein
VSFFKRLFGGLMGGGTAPAGDGAGRNAFWLYVRCNACGEAIRLRVSREHDLSAEFDGESDSPSSYHMAKEIVGQKCFRRIHVEMTFDGSRHPSDRQITGGTFITREEYDAVQAEQEEQAGQAAEPAPPASPAS